ncbi:MAG: DUF4367 domain-containing protein [Clostridia bacterium]|nr:MAG: DUF4367 domain-containing protein [Clostridia bacterium]
MAWPAGHMLKWENRDVVYTLRSSGELPMDEMLRIADRDRLRRSFWPYSSIDVWGCQGVMSAALLPRPP